jgi:hypothetical protein
MTEHIEYRNGKHVVGVGAPLFLAAVLENVCEDIIRTSEIATQFPFEDITLSPKQDKKRTRANANPEVDTLEKETHKKPKPKTQDKKGNIQYVTHSLIKVL